jgi:hypothetical protein
MKFFGIPDRASSHVAPFLLSSGQAGINVALQIAKSCYRVTSVTPIGGTYVGARDLFETENLQSADLSSQTVGESLLWICSSDFSEKQRLKLLAGSLGSKFFVIDTTCWSLGDPIIGQLLDHLKDIPGALIRSHSKLDMGGIEYGSLGSIAVISSRPRELEELKAVADKVIRLTGSVPSVDDVPPYFFNSDYWDFLESRCHSMTEIAEELKVMDWVLPPGVRMTFPEHGRYFFIFFSMERYPNQEKKFQDLLHKCLLVREVPHQFMPSFGFDECVISAFQSSDLHGEFIVRVSPGIGESRSSQLGGAVMEFLKLAQASDQGT